MSSIIRAIHNFIEILTDRRSRKFRHVMLALSVVVVFVTTYLLILPAIALERDAAAETGGIDVPAAEVSADTDAGDAETQSGADSEDAAGGMADPDRQDASGSTDGNAGGRQEDTDRQDAAGDAGEPGVTDGAGMSGENDPGSADDPGLPGDDVSGDADDTESVETGAPELIFEGGDYTVTITDKNGILPAGAGIEAEEITKGSKRETAIYDDYVARTEEALGWDEGSAEYIRLFDIRIVDENGDKYDIPEPVDVKIEISDMAGKVDASVVHFADDSDKPDIVSGVEVDGDAVRFEAEGFSAYAIVQGPSAIPVEWQQLSTLAELSEAAEEGVYIGTTSGYYMTNQTAAGTSDATTTGIVKTKPASNAPSMDTAARYFLEPAEGNNTYYIYCLDDDNNRQYVRNTGDANLTFTGEADKTAFEVLVDNNGRFRFHNGNRYWNMWNGANGNHIAAWTTAGDGNNYFYIFRHDDEAAGGDPYDLDGKTYGLMNWNGGTAGKAMMAESHESNHLDAMALTVMSKAGDNSDKLFVSDDSDISLWTFNWISDDEYYITTEVDGSVRYLSITGSGISLVSTPGNTSRIKVIPGTGSHAGELSLRNGNNTLTYSGSVESGFSKGGKAGTEWLKLAEISELGPEYFMTYSANKVSVSDPAVTNGSHIIVYTRVWNDTDKKYEFYAVDHDGSLVRCYESGNSIQWVGSRLNSLLWDFNEYYWEGTETPNNYYDFYNEYSQDYLEPQAYDGDILSDSPVGVNLEGRKNGRYYTTILSWDDGKYAYAGLKADIASGKVVECSAREADDFYFAIMQDISPNDDLHTVDTVDHVAHGITMKITDFSSRTEMSDFLGSNAGGAVNTTDAGLLSTNLDENGYPTTKAGNSFSDWFADAEEVNHFFIESTYNATGYYQYDSAQNFASLNDDGTFTVYKEIATVNSSGGGSGVHYQHGQFFPYNDLEAGVFSTDSPQNLTTSGGKALPESDPRKYEQLYLVKNQNYYLGVELEASFVQSVDGTDHWGHDIIYEFTGDDDFWLYVDGELIIDLGGIHNALSGSVNFRTGDVIVNGNPHTLRELFEDNYRKRNPEASEDEVAGFLAEYFEEGSTVFKPYTTHTMNIFYLERGAGASNLNMKFNLASVRPGTVQLSKELSGVDTTESSYAVFPYQIKYKTSELEHAEEYDLIQGTGDDVTAVYKDTNIPVRFAESYTVGGVTYENVFLLEPDEIAEIEFPSDMTTYRIIECGVNTAIYDEVSANSTVLSGTQGDDYPPDREDFGIDYATAKDRARVAYNNHVNEDALRTLTIDKKLFREDGTTSISQEDDPSTFSFRLYFGTEADEDLALADMYTYHVKDPQGHYCTWDTSSLAFVPTEWTDYSGLTTEEKHSVSFTTSMNGAISKIPVGYRVEIREVLAGTQFMVEERDNEIPDGYSRQKYVMYYDIEDAEPSYTDPTVPPRGIIVTGEDPHVDVCNLKGWGLRVNKIWSDADYMADRDPVYFAVFTDDGGGNLTMIDGTLRRMAYRENTLYWYFLPLPVDVPFNNYEIREVIVDDPAVDSDGYVTSYGSAVPVDDGEKVRVTGTQKGESESSEIEYSVLYDKGTVEDDSNVRVDKVTNNRPGIELRKEDWSGNALGRALFELKDNNDYSIGTFTSGNDGLITVAFLRDDVDYRLTEIDSPDGYRGLPDTAVIRLSNGEVTVSGIGEEYYRLEQTGTPTLTLRNRPYTLRFVKTDKADGSPLAGVHFQLHKQITVDNVVDFDVNPMSGYDDLVSEADGTIPRCDNTLPAGTYQLREKVQKEGYQKLSSHIEFTISRNGEVSLIRSPDDVTLTETAGSTVDYVVTVPNTRLQNVSVWKTDFEHNTITAGASFVLYRAEDFDDDTQRPHSNAVPVTQGTTGTDGILSLGALMAGDYRLVESEAPEGYDRSETAISITVTASEVRAMQSGNPAEVYQKGHDYWVSGQPDDTWQIRIWNNQGIELPHTGGIGTTVFYMIGTLLVAICSVVLAAKKRLGSRR